MKVIFKYDALLQNLVDLSLVVEDIMTSDDMKNVIFKFTKEDVQLIGINQVVNSFKRTLPRDTFRLEISDEELKDGVAYMQLKSKELIGYLNTYKTLRRTEVEDVELSVVNNYTVVCKVFERDLETGKTITSSYSFNNVPIKPNMLGNINLTASNEDEGENVAMEDILLYTRNMLPIMKNDTGLFGQLVFGENGVVVAFNASFTTFMLNKLPSCFNGIKLSYRAISFIDKIFANDKFVVCKKLERHLHIYSEDSNSEAFIIYDSKLPNYSVTQSLFTKDHAFTLDRVYFKDILKRLSLVNESIELVLNCDENMLEVKNSKFHQTMPILQKKDLEEYNRIGFKILPDTLNKVIIGSDDEFSPETFVYYCPQPNGDAILVFTDSSGVDGNNVWFSVVKVRPYR